MPRFPNDRGLVAQTPDRAVFRGDPMLHVERLAIHVVVVFRFGDAPTLIFVISLRPGTSSTTTEFVFSVEM